MAQKITVFWCKTDPDILLYMEFKYTRPIQKDFQRDDNITKRQFEQPLWVYCTWCMHIGNLFLITHVCTCVPLYISWFSWHQFTSFHEGCYFLVIGLTYWQLDIFVVFNVYISSSFISWLINNFLESELFFLFQMVTIWKSSFSFNKFYSSQCFTNLNYFSWLVKIWQSSPFFVK